MKLFSLNDLSFDWSLKVSAICQLGLIYFRQIFDLIIFLTGVRMPLKLLNDDLILVQLNI